MNKADPDPGFGPALLKGGASLAVLGSAMLDGGAAHAGNKALKEQARALKAAMAERAAAHAEQPAQADDHYARARTLLAADDLGGAMGAFKRVLAETPDSVDAMNGLAVVYDRMGRHDVARGWYDAALSVAPDDGAVLANLGYSLGLQGRWRDAIPFLRAAIASPDQMAAATARRLLARASAEITRMAAAAPLTARPAEIALVTTNAPAPVLQAAAAPERAPAQAAVQTAAAPVFTPGPARMATSRVTTGPHIEMVASGEAVLVMNAAPAPALVAALGEDAVLVLRPQRPVELAVVKVPVPARARVTIVRAETMLARTEAVLEMPAQSAAHSAAQSAAHSLPASLPISPRITPQVVMAAAHEPRRRKPAVSMELADVRVAMPKMPAALPLGVAPADLARPSIAPPPILQAADKALALPEPEAAPAWLLHVRRDGQRGRTGPSVPALALATDQTDGPRQFDSDDDALNRLAARMRGQDLPGGSAAARQAAVARLEALVERLRRS